MLKHLPAKGMQTEKQSEMHHSFLQISIVIKKIPGVQYVNVK